MDFFFLIVDLIFGQINFCAICHVPVYNKFGEFIAEKIDSIARLSRECAYIILYIYHYVAKEQIYLILVLKSSKIYVFKIF